MNGTPLYVLDANVFIEAAKGYYAFDIAPSFWEALITEAAHERVLSIDRVKNEIDRGDDDLKQWAGSSFHPWFVSTDTEDVVEAYRKIMLWAHHQTQFTDAAKAEFSRTENADAWIVAYSLTKESVVVVTLERFDPNVKRKIPIPNVCQGFNIQYIDTFEFLRTSGVRLG